MTDLVSKERVFWNRIADKYALRPIANHDRYQQKVTLTQGFFERDMDVLEFGCGTGSTAIQHAPYVKHILAVDLAEKMLDHGRERAADAGISNITFRQSAIETLDIEAASFDVVLGLNILHLCKDPLACDEEGLLAVEAWRALHTEHSLSERLPISGADGSADDARNRPGALCEYLL